jgi:purine-binding chemotaxis protein CheW
VSVRNVLVFGLGPGRHALELRWIREIFTLVAMTPVPTAPAVVDGVVNFKGAIVPVLNLRALLGVPARRPPQPGDALVLVDVVGTRAALAVDRIDTVTSLDSRGDELVDGAGLAVPLVDPTALVAAVSQIIEGGHGARA